MVRSDAVILANGAILLVILNVDSLLAAIIVLDGAVVNRIVPDLADILHGRSYDLIEFPAFLLVRVQWRSHIQVLLVVVVWDVGHRRCINRVPLTLHHSLILDLIGNLSCLLNSSRHFHLPLEVQL